MAGTRVTPRRRKPLRAAKKGPPPQARTHTPCCRSSAAEHVAWSPEVPLALCRKCGTLLTRSHSGALTIKSATPEQRLAARPVLEEMFAAKDELKVLRAIEPIFAAAAAE